MYWPGLARSGLVTDMEIRVLSVLPWVIQVPVQDSSSSEVQICTNKKNLAASANCEQQIQENASVSLMFWRSKARSSKQHGPLTRHQNSNSEHT